MNTGFAVRNTRLFTATYVKYEVLKKPHAPLSRQPATAHSVAR
jgi:hypothetical protein